MARYFFNVYDGLDLPDDTGTELPDIAAVRAAAVRAAGEAIRDLGDRFWRIKEWRLDVTDDQGRQVLSLNFSGSMNS
jgi:hypothetical protein